MDEKSEKYIELLCEALQMFYKNDAEALFFDAMPIGERAMVGCVYRYLWALRYSPRYDKLEPDVDIEYDRMQKQAQNDTSYLRKVLDCSCTECLNYSSGCWNEIKKRIPKHNCTCGKRLKNFIPDLIIHKRNVREGKNGLIVEFKKEGEDLEWDKLKVQFCSCPKSNFKYTVGALVVVDKASCEIEVYQGYGTPRQKWEVSASRIMQLPNTLQGFVQET